MKFDKLKEEQAINTAERIQHAIEIMEAVREGKLKTYNPETHVAVPKKPTHEIRCVIENGTNVSFVSDFYRAMIKAYEESE